MYLANLSQKQQKKHSREPVERSKQNTTNPGGIVSVPEQLHKEGEQEKGLNGVQQWPTSSNLEGAQQGQKEL